MAIVKCPQGHNYNTDDYSACPYCEKVSANDRGYDWTDVSGGTEVLGGRGTGGYGGGTEVIGGGNGGYGGGNSGYGGGTEVIGGGNAGANDYGGGTQVIDGRTGEHPNDPDQTEPAWNKKEYQHQPVVGWLVCIEGPDKGKDFSLHGAKSSIGRRKDSSICLQDPKISRDGYPAVIVYDDRKSHKFYLASGDASARNNVELDGDMLLGQSVIDPYDEIRIEDTVLVFVPFCGEDFYWDENSTDQMR